ncbi:Uncharacterised protein [Mycobacterium tuberculosis]|nr:Uncharacterised protein [Mycobacterium tuberculosis]
MPPQFSKILCRSPLPILGQNFKRDFTKQIIRKFQISNRLQLAYFS